MDQPLLQISAWIRAMTLTERIDALPADRDNIPLDRDRAQRRLKRWQSQQPFEVEAYLQRRLEMDRLTPDEFKYILGEPLDILQNRLGEPAEWAQKISRAFSEPFEPVSLPEDQIGSEATTFLNGIQPLLRLALDDFQEGLDTLSDRYAVLPYDPATITDLIFTDLLVSLVSMMERTLVLELNVARVQGNLQGETGAQRFKSFGERLRQPAIMLAILEEYPVLARQLMKRIEQWVSTSLEFLDHLCADWSRIMDLLSPETAPGLLVGLSLGHGDTHRNGHSVGVATFSSGFKVVYKPRSLHVDIHFQELLNWINERGQHPGFRTVKIVDGGDHGWMEFIQTEPCTSEQALVRFYERMGGFTALLYALEATDFHCENLFAAGEHPILTDLEALFHPRIEGVDITDTGVELGGQAMSYSVLRTGLLPNRSNGVDISGMSNTEGQMTPQFIPCWDSMGTDEMRINHKRIELPAGNNSPTMNGGRINVLDYAKPIARGFTAIYRLIMSYRDDLLSPQGPLAAFHGDEVRFIIRPTQTYSLFLHDIFYPNVLRDALDRDFILDRLWQAVPGREYLTRLIAAEREDLARNDVPIFTTHPDSRDVWDSGSKRIPDLLDEPGLESVRKHIQQFSEANLEQQLWFVNASLATLAGAGLPDNLFEDAQADDTPKSDTVADREQLIAAAAKIADRLDKLALRGGQKADWIGLATTAEMNWTLSPLGPDLYEGLPGVILFLAYIGKITGEERYTTLAKAGLARLQANLKQDSPPLKLVGGYTGWGGIVYTFAHLGVLWNDPDLFVQAENVISLLPPLIDQDENFDVLLGVAGCIGGLLALYHVTASQPALKTALQCGERLIAQAQAMPVGKAWAATIASENPLTGFSHGAAGIAWALLKLAEVTGNDRFHSVALEALAYEQNTFVKEVGNWPDFRSFEELDLPPGTVNTMTAWCHGAPGIGLARLSTLNYLNTLEIQAEIDAALGATFAYGFSGNHSMCHGTLGNLELALQASLTRNDEVLRAKVYRIAGDILNSIDRDGWLCGVPRGIESPGFMTGLAGIGYELLRLADPTQVPSILVLAPPMRPNFLIFY